MKIKNIEGLSGDQIREMVNNGGKFVMYTYCISIVLATFRRGSSIYFIPPGKSAVSPGLKHLATSTVVGWWGIPWGPIYTIGSIAGVLSGGKDVTTEVMRSINQSDPTYGNSGYGQLGNASSTPGDNSAPTYNIN